MKMTAIIEVNNVSVQYGQNEVLKEVSFSIEYGDFIGLAGSNGAGKTTLIKAILGLVPISSGSITLFNKPYRTFTDWGKIGYLPQKSSSINSLFPATVEEVVLLGLLSQKKWPKKIRKEDKAIVEEILADLGIFTLKKRMLSELSGGQQQRVLLARALVSRPQILIFDEPSTSLDAKSREAFFELIEKLNEKNGITIILITHDTGDIGKFANKLLYLDKKLVYFGTFSDFCKSEEMSVYFGEHDQHLICHQHD
jgi:zinc transport system ATP-binding protein